MDDLADREGGKKERQKEDNNKFLKSCIQPAHFGYNEKTDVFKDINGTADPEGNRRNPRSGTAASDRICPGKGLSPLNGMEILRKNRTTCIIAIVFDHPDIGSC